MATKNLKMTFDRVGPMMAALRSLNDGRVLVGIPADNGGRTPEPGSGETINNAALLFIHENGSPAKNIPARPSVMPGIRAAQPQIADLLESSIRSTLSVKGSSRSSEQTLHAVGLIAQTAIKKKIVDGPFAPLKPQTLRRRRAKGRKGTKPLLDTTQMYGAITYVVESK